MDIKSKELSYTMEWSCPEMFTVWISTDRSEIQFCGPDGEVIVSKPLSTDKCNEQETLD